MISSRSDSPFHWFLFVRSVGDIRSPFCCLGMKPPLNSFIFFSFFHFFLIFPGRLSCCFWRFSE